MLLIYLIVNYLYRKYGVPLHNFFENWTRGISHLNIINYQFQNVESFILYFSFFGGCHYFMYMKQNRESTEGYSKSIVR